MKSATEHVDSNICSKLVDAINIRDFDQVRRLFHSDYSDIDLSRSRHRRDGNSFLNASLEYLSNLDDLFVRATVAFTREDRVGLYWMVSTTQSATLLGIPPTNRVVRFCGFSTLHIREGIISQGLHLWDMAGLLRELRLLADLTDNPDRFDSVTHLFSVFDRTVADGQTGSPGCGA